jgi:hypothetical protein
MYYESWKDCMEIENDLDRRFAIRVRLRAEALARPDLPPMTRWALEQPMSK